MFTLVLPIPLVSENIKSFGALLDIASFSFFNYNFKNKQHFRNFFKSNIYSGQSLHFEILYEIIGADDSTTKKSNA